MSPLISVIIPVYNGAEFLPEAIANVLAQGQDSLEIIVVNDGSTDETAEIATQLNGPIRYVDQPNQGPAAARNYGLTLAQGEFIAFLDVDDQWPPDKLSLQLAAFAVRPEVDIVNGYVQLLQGTVTEGGTITFRPRYVPVVSFNLGSALFRRSVFDRVGPFDAQQIHSEDVDWFMHAREMGVNMVVLEAVTLFYRKHDSNLTHDRQENLKGFMRAVRQSIQRRQQAGTAASELPRLQYLNAEGEIVQKDTQGVVPLTAFNQP